MQIEKATIKNFKGIRDTEIIFHPGFNLIKGENGKGKTFDSGSSGNRSQWVYYRCQRC